jgi:hypothetical protein
MKRRVLLLACLLLSVVACPSYGQPAWCWDLDYFTTSVSDGVITVLHNSAAYNCCPDYFDYAIDQADSLIWVEETEVLGGVPCPCICCYDIPVQIGPVSPGRYRIWFHWHDYESGPQSTLLEVVVPDYGKQGLIAGFDQIVEPPPCQETPPASLDPETPVGPDGADGAARSRLRAVYPNPARQSVTIDYELRSAGPVSLEIFSACGNRVRILVERFEAAGPRQAVWDGRDQAGVSVAAGVYFCRLRGGGATAHQQGLVLIR